MIEIIRGKDQIKFIKLIDNIEEVFEAIKHNPDENILWLDFKEVDPNLILLLLKSEEIKLIKRIHFSDQSKSIIFFNEFSHWKTLSFGFDGAIFDFSNQKELIQLGGIWSKNWSGLNNCISLEEFHVSAFKDEVTNIPNLNNISRLILIQPSIVSLKGIEAAINLSEIELLRATKLMDISHFSSKNRMIKKVVIDGCKKIQSYDSIANLKTLDHLALLNSSCIYSLEILKSLPSLTFLNLYKTKLIELDTLKFLSPKVEFHGAIIK